MQLAANAAGLVMWNWDILRDRIAMAQGHEHPRSALLRQSATSPNSFASSTRRIATP
jgi:hypothetical protein